LPSIDEVVFMIAVVIVQVVESQGRIDDTRLVDERQIIAPHASRDRPSPPAAHQTRRSKTQRGQRRTGR
jgi:hypothetical protein